MTVHTPTRRPTRQKIKSFENNRVAHRARVRRCAVCFGKGQIVFNNRRDFVARDISTVCFPPNP